MLILLSGLLLNNLLLSHAGCAFVKLDSVEAAEAAIAALNNVVQDKVRLAFWSIFVVSYALFGAELAVQDRRPHG